ncbi:MAG: hypothetical protein ABSG25_08785, partial [Bryobacteraceae bacterium]
MNKINLSNFKNNIYSQNGEDGIIEEILNIIPDKNKWCCEFGAWDGIFLSNTHNLIKNKDYSSIQIEADSTKYLELVNNYKDNKKVIPVNKMI